ncbi:hypothetical protein [Streptomyces sp. B21-083]|uniref:hypothetical protein n=1 Tax=Streptomyces sp. B21-083 TaxID=3039410 RepID=UPI002FEEDC9F
MDIEVLVVPDCPNAKTAADRLRRALDDIGLRETGVTTRVIDDRAEAERDGFTGSPTIFVDGRDLFTEPGRPPGLSCRVYRTPDGLAGVPDVSQLRRALTAAADASPHCAGSPTRQATGGQITWFASSRRHRLPWDRAAGPGLSESHAGGFTARARPRAGTSGSGPPRCAGRP